MVSRVKSRREIVYLDASTITRSQSFLSCACLFSHHLHLHRLPAPLHACLIWSSSVAMSSPRRSARSSQPIPSSPLAQTPEAQSNPHSLSNGTPQGLTTPNGLPPTSSPLFFQSSSIAPEDDGDRTPRANVPSNGPTPAAGGESLTHLAALHTS